MRSILPVVSVIGLIGAGAAVTWSVMARLDDAFMTSEVAHSFNLQTGPAPVRAPMRLAAGETLRDAVAAAPPAPSSLMRPIATPGMAVGGLPGASAPKPYTVITPGIEARAKRNKYFAGLLARPARFLMSRSSLSSARGLRAFLADPKKVDAYMNSSLVRVALNSPAVAKALLGNPVVIRAFFATPALRDPAAVRDLLVSPMLHKMLDCPAIQEALGDPVVMRRMIADPGTVSWISANPRALMAVAQAAPSLGQAFSARTR